MSDKDEHFPLVYNSETQQWESADPMGWQGSGPDFEVYGDGPYRWFAYIEHDLVARGKARTKLGLNWALMRAARRLR